MRTRAELIRLAALGMLVPLLACCAPEQRDESGRSASPATSPSTSPSVTPSGSPPAPALPPVRQRPSLPALMRVDDPVGRIRTTQVEVTTDAYVRAQVTYRSGDHTVSGVLLRPHGDGPFPGIVLNHGYIEPSEYVTGQGLAREQDRLAREGFVVLHTDYRGHAGSDPTSALDAETRIGYARDAINAVGALRRLPYVDADRMAMLGRSMGGGVTLNALVARPGLVDAAVVYASVSSRYGDNLQRWTVPERPEEARRLQARYGDGVDDALSARTYVDRITESVLMFHGTSDDSCPVRWSHATHRALNRAGVDSRLVIYPGEEHAFVPRWEDSIVETVDFLRHRLR